MQKYEICGFTLKFYRVGDVLPLDFLRMNGLMADQLVSIQHGKEYKQTIELIKLSLKTGREMTKESLRSEQGHQPDQEKSLIVSSNDSFESNPAVFMFYTPSRKKDEDSLPKCDDFIVYYIKRHDKHKALRLFQCHCPRI